MKVKNCLNVSSRGLTRKQLRAMERKEGVYLDKPVCVLLTDNQQFGVYDEDEVYIDDIQANGRYFSELELHTSIIMLSAGGVR